MHTVYFIDGPLEGQSKTYNVEKVPSILSEIYKSQYVCYYYCLYYNISWSFYSCESTKDMREALMKKVLCSYIKDKLNQSENAMSQTPALDLDEYLGLYPNLETEDGWYSVAALIVNLGKEGYTALLSCQRDTQGVLNQCISIDYGKDGKCLDKNKFGFDLVIKND